MISNTEALVLGIMAIYTIAIVYGIHHYEAKMKKIKNDNQNYYTRFMESNERANQIQTVFQAVHNQSELVNEQNRELRMQNMLLQSEITELRSGIYTGYPASTVGSIGQDTTEHYDRLKEIWSQGGMGIVNAEITNNNSNEFSKE
jgi:hypothetical protein